MALILTSDPATADAGPEGALFAGRLPGRGAATHAAAIAAACARGLVALVAFVVTAAGAPLDAPSAPPAALIRFPDASRERIAFVALGDLWTVPRDGGTATALTRDAGQVFLPRFSPNGRSLAFTWRQGGTEDTSGSSPPRVARHAG